MAQFLDMYVDSNICSKSLLRGYINQSSRGGIDLGQKLVVFGVAFVVFVGFFFALDFVLQSSQGLELFPSNG